MTKPTELGSAIRRLREATRLTQLEFASQVGVRPETVSRWERGENKPLGLAKRSLNEVARKYGLPPI